MCLLTYFPPNVMPDAEKLRNGAIVNDDGHGYAIIIDDEVVVGRAMDFEEVLAEFLALRAEYPDGEAMFHSRYSTCGVTTDFNVHPFHVKRSPLTVLAHNGHIHQAAPAQGDPRVDSRIFAEDILMSKFPVLDSPRTQRRLSNFIGKYNKLVILTVDPRFAKRAYIVNEDEGMWVGGVWYSNSGYLPPFRYAGQFSTSYYSSKGGADYGWDDEDGWTRDKDGVWRWRPETRRDYTTWWNDALDGAERLAEGTYARKGVEGYTAPLKADTDFAKAARKAIAAFPAFCCVCQSTALDAELRYCTQCGTCIDCERGLGECTCIAGEEEWENGPEEVKCGMCWLTVGCECEVHPCCGSTVCLCKWSDFYPVPVTGTAEIMEVGGTDG